MAPFYDEATKETTFSNGTDAIVALELYQRQGFLRPTTLFATIQIDRLCTMYPHAHMIQFVERFLDEHVPSDRIPNLSHQTIMALVRFVIANQFFIIDNALCRQKKGGPSNSSLSTLFGNLYLFYLQKDLVTLMKSRKEVFGRYDEENLLTHYDPTNGYVCTFLLPRRCFDQIFVTWNGSPTELDHVLNEKARLPMCAFRLSITRGMTVSYLDVQITNKLGLLHTKVFHECPFEPYILPCIPNQTPSTSRSMASVRTALIRAVRCCNHLEGFELEKYYIRLSFTMNHFPLSSIEQGFNSFYEEFQWTEPHSRLQQSAYIGLRQRIRDYDRRYRTLAMRSMRRGWRDTQKLTNATLSVDAAQNFKKKLKRRWEDETQILTKRK